MKYILIAVVSKDGFIARNSRHLPMEWTSKEEKSHFKKSINNCDWSAMGRNTHELFYNENRKRIIFTSSVNTYKFINNKQIYYNPQNFSFKNMINSIKPVKTICILGGTKVHDYFLEYKLINELIITVEPVYFGGGLPLFTKIQWNNFPKIFLNEGLFREKIKKKINKKGTRYFHLIKN